MTDGVVRTDTILDRILNQTAVDLKARRTHVSCAELEAEVRELERVPLSLAQHLRSEHVAVIAEVKRGSPSRGRFPVEFEPADLAAEYRQGGAAAVSCLTDGPFFHGSLDDLSRVADVLHGGSDPIPVLRKDFILDRYQLLEALVHGADVVLLIASALEDDLLHQLHAQANEMGLSTLIEVHNEREVERALRLDPEVIGVNNRDLHTFTVDLAVTERLASMASDRTCLVSESGIFTTDDVERVAVAGADAVLVGESLILRHDRASAVRQLAGVRQRGRG